MTQDIYVSRVLGLFRDDFVKPRQRYRSAGHIPRKLNRALLQRPGRLRESVRAAGAVLHRVRAEVVVGSDVVLARHAKLDDSARRYPVESTRGSAAKAKHDDSESPHN